MRRAQVVGNHLAFMLATLHHHRAAEDDLVQMEALLKLRYQRWFKCVGLIEGMV
jgi:hypothetical protein